MVVDSREAGLLSPADGERLRDALELGTRPVGEILVPRAEDAYGRRTASPRPRLERTAADAGLLPLPGHRHRTALCWATCTSRTPSASADRDSPFPRAALHPVTRVRIDTPLDDALTALRGEGSHLAAVTGRAGHGDRLRHHGGRPVRTGRARARP